VNRLVRPLAIAALAALLLQATTVSAAEPRFELTPFAGYRLSGELESDDGTTRTDVKDGNSWGFELAMYRDPESYYQLLYSRRDAGLTSTDETVRATDVRIEYFHVGGTLLFPQPQGLVGYVSATVGLTRLDALRSGYETDREFSASLGGGYRFPITERLHANLGLRAYATFVDSDTGLVCIGDGGQATCLLTSSSSLFWELEGHAGLSFRF